MPELPEVETIKREISPYLKGKTVKGIEVLDPRLLKGVSTKEFRNKLIGQKILRVERRAKYILCRLNSGRYLVIHLGMTGRLLKSPDPYVKIILDLGRGGKLYYSDARLFGKLRIFDRYPDLDLGPEPLSVSFNQDVFKKILRGRRGKIKTLLLDQRFLAGVGNIYAQEALFEAGIHPARGTDTLTAKEIRLLYRSIRKVLSTAVTCRGTSVDWYVDAEGKKGRFQLKLKVYGRKDKPCFWCKTPIRRILMSQRGTCFCPKCQK